MEDDHGIEETLDGAGQTANEKSARRTLIAVIVIVVLLLAGLAAGVFFLAGNPTQTETIRDIFIILLALEFLVIGAAIVVLIVQIARLTALLENEIKPILASTNETVNTLRGTSEFLSNQLVNPVVKTYSSLSAVRRIFDLFRPTGHQRKE
jgi:flagellar basal body-associated protein FliL